MGGGPVAPHIKGCPSDCCEVREPQTAFEIRLARANAVKGGCSELCIKARGEHIYEVEKPTGKGSMASDIPDDDYTWMRVMAMAFASGQQYQRRDLQEIGKIPIDRHNQLDIGSVPREMPEDNYSWIKAMEVYHSSEQPNRVV